MSLDAAFKKGRSFKQLTTVEKGAATSEDLAYFLSLEAPPSFLPKQKLCDVTSVPCAYTDPKTGLNYSDRTTYRFIELLSPAAVHARLALRNASTEVK